MIKTKLDLIKDIEAFIETNLEKVRKDIYKGQNRIDWKQDYNLVYNIETILQDAITTLQSITLEDIK